MFYSNIFAVNAKSFVVVQARIIKNERKVIKIQSQEKTYNLGSFVPIELFCFSSKAVENHKDYNFHNLRNKTAVSYIL